jgi:5'-AMP-activated protein kinase, regulatory beta subunit
MPPLPPGAYLSGFPGMMDPQQLPLRPGGRSASDASMTIMDAHDPGSGISTTTNSGAGSPTSSIDALLEDDTVPTVFRWEHGGRQVYITGTFNGWSRQIPMHRSGNDFTYIHNLKRGKHAFKFIVDDEWRFAPDQPTVHDIEGRINNFIDVTEFKAYTGDKDFDKEKAAGEYGIAVHLDSGDTGSNTNNMSDATASGDSAMAILASAGTAGLPTGGLAAPAPDKDGEVFTQRMPDVDDYTKEPPPLPPHLRHIILNKPPQLQDTAALPVPQHVALNHLYCTAIKDNMMVLGITQRFKTKFVTTVYYSPCSGK